MVSVTHPVLDTREVPGSADSSADALALGSTTDDVDEYLTLPAKKKKRPGQRAGYATDRDESSEGAVDNQLTQLVVLTCGEISLR